MPGHIIVASHRRSGTHLTIDAIANNLAPYRAGYFNLDTLNARHAGSVAVDSAKRKLDTAPHILKTHAHHDLGAFFGNSSQVISFVESLLNDSKLIYVVRDGRDVLTSLYYYVQRFRPEITEVSFSDFIRMKNEFESETCAVDFDRVQYWNYHLTGWLSRQDALVASFEGLIDDYESTLNGISEFVGVDLRGRLVDVRRKAHPLRHSLVYRAFSKLKRRVIDSRLSVGARLTSVEFRRGTRGDYVKMFSAQDLQYFWSVCRNLPPAVFAEPPASR